MEELLDTAFDVVRRFRDFDSYGTEAKARQALKRRRPGFSAKQYEEAFQKALKLFEIAVEVVEKHKDMLLKNWDHLQDVDHNEIDEEMRTRCSGFRASTRNSALGWIFYWHHLK